MNSIIEGVSPMCNMYLLKKFLIGSHFCIIPRNDCSKNALERQGMIETSAQLSHFNTAKIETYIKLFHLLHY